MDFTCDIDLHTAFTVYINSNYSQLFPISDMLMDYYLDK